MRLKDIFELKLHRNLVVRNSAYGFLDLVFSTLMTFLLTPILVYSIGIEQFGLWNICSIVLGFLGAFNLGLGDTVIRYVAEYHSKNDLEGVVGMIVAVSMLSIGLVILISAPLFMFMPALVGLFPVESVSSTQIQQTFSITLWGFIPMMLRGVLISVPKGFQDFKTAVLFRSIFTLITGCLAILIAFRKGTVTDMVTGAVIVSWVSLLFSIVIVARKITSLGIPLKLKVQKRHFGNILRFSVYTGLTGIGNVIFSVLDRITVGVVLGLSAAGYYGIAIGVAGKLPSIGAALTQSFFPAFSAWKTKHNPSEILKRLYYSTLAISLLSILMATFLIVFSRPLLTIWLGETTGMAILLTFRILVVAYAIPPCTAPAFQAANGLGYPWINTIGVLLMGSFTIIFIFVLGGPMGLSGTALANGATLFSLLIPIWIFYKLRTGPKLAASSP